MKIIASTLFIFLSLALYSQQTIDPGQEVMGSFASGDTECYELTIEEAGEYVLTYNLWDATMNVTNSDQQELFSDYMPTFESSPRSQELTLSSVGTYQICFSRGGETAMYQCRIVRRVRGLMNLFPLNSASILWKRSIRLSRTRSPERKTQKSE
ncbi:MAG: hypothetical protein U5K32_09045 [Bacteroidales bacterium]|nr:hypothetical protein [Bacteroidales bacterium]